MAERTLYEDPMAQARDSRAQDIRNAVPTNPAGSNPTARMASVIQTGTQAPKQATLINTTTGDRKAVVVGSQDAQQLFGQGYVLEQSPGVPVASAQRAPQAPAPAPTPTPYASPFQSNQDRIEKLRTQAGAVKQNAFEAVYGMPEEEWNNQPPSMQRELRRQRVMTLSGQLGDIESAIRVAQDEIKTAKEEATNTLNSYIQFGVLGQIEDAELQDLASRSGLSVTALKSLANKKEPPELRSGAGGSLYAVAWDPDKGEFSIDTLIGPTFAGDGGGGSGSGSSVSPAMQAIAQAPLANPDDPKAQAAFANASATQQGQIIGLMQAPAESASGAGPTELPPIDIPALSKSLRQGTINEEDIIGTYGEGTGRSAIRQARQYQPPSIFNKINTGIDKFSDWFSRL